LLQNGDIANASKLAPLIESQRKSNAPQPGQSIGSGGLRLPDGTIIPPGARPEGAEKTPDKVRQFQYAQSPAGGNYKGSFENFVGIGPSITAGAMAPLRAAQTQNIGDENAYNLPPPQAPAGFSVTAPDGKVYSFKSQGAANAFKARTGGR